MRNRNLFASMERPTFAQAIMQLIGHLAGGGVLFVTLAFISWALGLGVDTLNGIHPFSPSVLTLLHTVELWVFYIDIALSGIVMLVGAFRFLREMTGDPP